ncbi:MAG: PAS domain S-box protein [Anaerolineae bacterium]|nr:PAS domain S-box protein [Anaerolineae bacterium]
MTVETPPRRHSEELYQALFEQAADGIFIADAKGHYIEVNRRGYEMLGYTRAEILSLSMEDLIPNADRGTDPLEIDALRAGKNVLKERRLCGQDGRLLPVEINARMLSDGRFLEIVRDLSKRKATEKQLHNTIKELQRVTTSISDYLWSAELDEAGNWAHNYYSPVVEKITGYPPEFFLESPERWLSTVYPDDQTRLLSALQRIISRQSEREEEEYRIIRADGTLCWVRDSVTVTRLGPDHLRVDGVVSDITARKRTEEMLRQSHEELRLFFSQTTNGCFFMMLDEPVRWDETIDQENVLDYVFDHQRITRINDAMLAHYGATREQMLNFTPNDFFRHDLAHGRDLWRQRFNTGKIRLESDERKLDGTPIWIEGEYIVLYDAQGRITGHFGIQRDITERKQMQAEHQAHLWFLESLDQVNQAMHKTTDITHMMRNVLDVVLTVFACDRAWLVYPCDPDADSWEVPMERTRPEYPGGRALGTKLPITPQMAKNMRLLNSSSTPITFGPESEYTIQPWLQQEFSVQSIITTALFPKSDKPWAFGLHQCSSPRVWTTQEKRLFQEIGRRMADSLTSLLAYRDLRESQNKLAEAERIAHIGYWEYDIEQRRINLSDEACRIFGLQPRESSFDVTLIRERIHPEDLLRLEHNRDEALQGRRYDAMEYRIILPNGDIRFVHSQSNVVRDTGQPRRLFGTTQDITERRRAEDELRASEARFRTFVDHATDAFFLRGDQGIILDVNRQACESLGYTREELIGMTPYDFDPGFDKAIHKELMIRIEAGEVVEFESTHQRKDGTMFPVEIRIRPFWQGERRFGLALVRDITERKKLEAENKQLTAQFYQAQKMESIGQLAGGIAHDFNNLLVPIIGYIELNLAALDPTSQLYADLTVVIKAANRAADLTRQIVAFSRQQVLELSLLNLNSVIANFQRMLQRLLGEEIELQTFLTPDIVPIKADKSQIEQVILNLAINARDAMPTGGKLTIETSNVYLDETYAEKYTGSLAPGDYIMLAVSDTGQGIDGETQKRIFEPFFTTKAQGQGTGLGLATVFGIIKQHQGHILVYSEPDNGTTFKIYLPKAKEIQPSIVSPTTEPVARFGTETILVVEDEEMVRKLVCETLESYGYDVLEALSPTDGLTLASNKSTIHLLVTDVIMPEMNGKEVYHKVAEIHPTCKVLYISGYSSNIIGHHGMLDEGINFLQKPFTVRDLARKVRNALL